ncbi:Type I restriction-modification system, specificity subunit S [Pseudomonas chlororaphis subsp. aurantiaca]|uniref:restriction endonuclease subunit S n=1 Tax=Pseudomonas chlororaphis TaxID=587753 RepID=UPI00087A971E|nr:restriction endonuclease subunit S [Pseudomonas chlororaphis]AZD35299.1 Type I restriction-modification system, specificity subunit S [Pseudomonas chlororaphis subsp. aurantiaca]AZD41632.1 Type I restriction-modification system, specificity subunit S [Pseudomonas chlororaphis subsp. aurantiaca]AZD66321.1 Type I restriction-modification system, specificity subunit S [Pseudomonas chlororaphis subsp. aurantiaca]QIT22399.1 restriction endonuclease subunit S [Pseudomonas chlororaphis subsp. auran
MSFPTYRVYKDSEVQWIGNVPEHWDICRLRNIFFIKKRIAGNLGLDVLSITNKGVKIKDIESGDGQLSSDYSKYQLVMKGDFAMNHMDLITGYVDISDFNGVTSPDYRVFSAAHPELDDPRFMLRLLQNAYHQRLFFPFGQGSAHLGRWRLPTEEFKDFFFPRPSRFEQTQIAQFLDHETARIDALIEEQQRLIELLKEKRQAVISHAVTKGLDPTVPMKDSGVEWLGEVPAHWEVGGLTRFIGPIVDYRGRTPTKVDDGIFLVTARNIRNGQIDYEASEEYADPESAKSLLARGRPEIGDLLFTMEAPLGQVALIDRTDIALAQRIVKFRGEPSAMRNHYLMFWFMSTTCQARLETLATGSTALGIKSSKLGMIECLAPTLNEQDAIVSYIQRESEKNDALVHEAESVISLLQERRSALISAAVTGKIDVRGWKPPASETSPELAQEAV